MSSTDEIPAFCQDGEPTPGRLSRPHRRSAKAGVQQSLSLPPVAVVRKPGITTTEAPASQRKLWLCLYLPRLPLDALRRKELTGYAVYEEQNGIRRILMVDEAAEAAGIEPGLPVNAALSLEPGLVLEARDTSREDRLLKEIAAWAERFTSFVVVESTQALLLEVAGSLRLFGGIGRIRHEIDKTLSAADISLRQAAAPTPLASLWLARSGRDHGQAGADDAGQLAGQLAAVPLSNLGWPPSVTDKMRGMGIVCIGDCLRLPRQGFARRFGVRYLNDLDRALGRLPDPRDHFRMPERFAADYEFESEQDDGEYILGACRQLLVKLERFLRTRQVQVQRIQFSFFHLRADATHIALGCVRAGQTVDHWFDLLRIRFEQLALPEPAIAIGLKSGRGEAASLPTPELLDTDGSRQAPMPIDYLVERLSARMGESSVQGVMTVAEHRPQYAWRATVPTGSPPHCAAAMPASWNEAEMPKLLEDIRRTNSLLLRRPLWILDTPESLSVVRGQPQFAGLPLQLEGPERLESGWWDESGIARDYFVARSHEGVCLWVYRDRRGEREDAWFLHGRFG